jgi:hypothetical protein
MSRYFAIGSDFVGVLNVKRASCKPISLASKLAIVAMKRWVILGFTGLNHWRPPFVFHKHSMYPLGI